MRGGDHTAIRGGNWYSGTGAGRFALNLARGATPGGAPTIKAGRFEPTPEDIDWVLVFSIVCAPIILLILSGSCSVAILGTLILLLIARMEGDKTRRADQ